MRVVTVHRHTRATSRARRRTMSDDDAFDVVSTSSDDDAPATRVADADHRRHRPPQCPPQTWPSSTLGAFLRACANVTRGTTTSVERDAWTTDASTSSRDASEEEAVGKTKGPSASATAGLEAFDAALRSDASNFLDARGDVGTTRYETLRAWVERSVEGYGEMREEHREMDARLRRAWMEFPERRREAVLRRAFEHMEAFVEEWKEHGDFERARGERGTPRFDGIATCETTEKSDLNASREELLATFKTARRDWQQKQRDDAKASALRHLEDFAREFEKSGDFESSRGPSESKRRVALAALAKKKTTAARAAGLVGAYADMIKTYSNAQKEWTAKKKTMLTDMQAMHLRDFLRDFAEHGDFRRARGETGTSRYVTLSAVADKRADKLCEPFQTQVIAMQNAWREYTVMKSKKTRTKGFVRGALTNELPRSVKPTPPVALAETKTDDANDDDDANGDEDSASEDARRDQEKRSVSSPLEDENNFYVAYKTNATAEAPTTTSTPRREEAEVEDERDDASNAAAVAREPEAERRIKLRRVNSTLDHLEDFYNEYKACKNFDASRGDRGGERFKALARLNECNADDYEQPHHRRILKLQHMWTSIDYF